MSIVRCLVLTASLLLPASAFAEPEDPPTVVQSGLWQIGWTGTIESGEGANLSRYPSNSSQKRCIEQNTVFDTAFFAGTDCKITEGGRTGNVLDYKVQCVIPESITSSEKTVNASIKATISSDGKSIQGTRQFVITTPNMDDMISKQKIDGTYKEADCGWTRPIPEKARLK